MPITEEEQDRIKKSLSEVSSGDGAPNGMNPGGAINTIKRLSQLMEDNNYEDYTDADRKT